MTTQLDSSELDKNLDSYAARRPLARQRVRAFSRRLILRRVYLKRYLARDRCPF